MSELFSQQERSSSSNHFKTKTEAMSMRQPSFASASANATDPNHPRGGEGVPAEVQVPNETESPKARKRHGDANSSHGPNPGLAPIGSDHDHRSHHTPSVGDPDVDTRWVLTTKPRPRPPPAPPGVDGASFLCSDVPHQAFRGFQGSTGIFHTSGGFGVSARPNTFQQPMVYTMDSQSQAVHAEVDDDDDDAEDEDEEEELEEAEQPMTTVINVAPSTLKVKKPTARRSTMCSINQATIVMCNQAGGKLFPPLKDEASVYGNIAISHVGIANVGSHPTYCRAPNVRHTFVPPPAPTQEVRVGGVVLALNSTPLVTSLANFMPLQRWTTAEREDLKANAREAFHKSMTSNILGKSNKLETMVIKINSPQMLKSVKNLQAQLEAISSHLHSHDCAQVMTIFIPVNIWVSSEVRPTMCDLMRDYAVLTEAVMGNSTTWINMWVESKVI